MICASQLLQGQKVSSIPQEMPVNKKLFTEQGTAQG